MRWQRLYNPIVGSLLRSPLHGLASGSTMLITFAGRKSGRNYTTPVNYVADGDDLLVVSRAGRRWWRNLRGGGPIGVRVRGQTLKGVGEAMEGEEAAEDGGLLTVLSKVPAYRRYWGVRLDANGRPEDPQALFRISQTNVLVRVRDLTPIEEVGRRGWRGEKARRGGAAGLWGRWVLANSLAETVGLGSAFGMGVVLFPYLNAPGLLVALATLAAAVLAGTLIEGTVVGTAQWLVLRDPFPGLRWRAWVLATAVGAFVAWTAGMLPSTLLSGGSETGGSAPAEPSAVVVYALSALMGLVVGAIFGTPQWFVLRRHVRRAAWWILANALAWAPGMVLAFYVVGLLFSGGVGSGTVILAILALAAIGAVVGAIHGLALVWLARPRPAEG